MSSARAAHVNASSPLLRFLLRNFVVFNPLFLVSAAAILGGAWLLNPPTDGGGRSLGLLFKLIGLIQLYEFALLGAGALLARQAGLQRDVRNLMLVLSPFLLDVTFTSSSLVVSLLNQVSAQAATGLALALVVLAALKAGLAARLCGQRFGGLEWAALLAGPALVALYPLSGAWLAGAHAESEIGLIGGLAVGLLVLLFGLATRESQSPLRRLAPLALVAASAHAAGTVWTYSGELTQFAGPVLIALGATLPSLAWPTRSDRVTPVLLPAVGALVLGASHVAPFGLNTWHVGLCGFAAVQGVFFYRHRSLGFLAALLLAGELAWGGASVRTSLDAIGHTPVEPVALLALFAFGLAKRSHPALLAMTLGLSVVLTARLGLLGSSLDGVLALDVLGFGILAWSHRAHGTDAAGARARFAGVFLLFVPAATLGLANGDELARWVGRGTVLALLLPAALTRLRVFAIPALILPVQGAIALAPSSSTGWGAIGIGAAFVLVSGGVWLSLHRERLLAWIDAAETTDRSAGRKIVRPASPHALTGHAAMGAALLAAVGWVLFL